jgi:hypothetical protein
MNRIRCGKKKQKKFINCFVYYRDTTDPVSKQPSVSSISSNAPVMTTSKDDDNPSTDVQSILNSFKTNTSIMRKSSFFE